MFYLLLFFLCNLTFPRKISADNNNIRKLKDRNQNGMPEISLPSGGQDQHHQAEAATKKNHQEALAERITELAAPQVCYRKLTQLFI